MFSFQTTKPSSVTLRGSKWCRKIDQNPHHVNLTAAHRCQSIFCCTLHKTYLTLWQLPASRQRRSISDAMCWCIHSQNGMAALCQTQTRSPKSTTQIDDQRLRTLAQPFDSLMHFGGSWWNTTSTLPCGMSKKPQQRTWGVQGVVAHFQITQVWRAGTTWGSEQDGIGELFLEFENRCWGFKSLRLQLYRMSCILYNIYKAYWYIQNYDGKLYNMDIKFHILKRDSRSTDSKPFRVTQTLQSCQTSFEDTRIVLP